VLDIHLGVLVGLVGGGQQRPDRPADVPFGERRALDELTEPGQVLRRDLDVPVALDAVGLERTGGVDGAMINTCG
jgi:hypothetical protein